MQLQASLVLVLVCSRLQQVLDKCSAQYEATGAPTVILGKHHHGYAVPLTVCGQEVGGGETAYTFRPSVVREEFLLVMSDTLTITAASHETMTMMGVRRALGGVSPSCLCGRWALVLGYIQA